MKYYLVFKRKEILQYAITWINLEDIMLSEISQSPKDKHCRFYLHEVLSQNHKDEEYNGGCCGIEGRGEWGVV